MHWWGWFSVGIVIGAALIIALTWGYVWLSGKQR